MSNTIFMVKLVKRDTETDASFKMREHLYKKAIENHNLMVWSTLDPLVLSNRQPCLRERRRPPQ